MAANNKVRFALLFLLASVVAGVSLYQWWSNPERTIKNRLEALAETLSVPASDGDLGRLARVTRLRPYFAEDVHVRAGPPGSEINSRDALLGVLGGWMAPPGGFTIEFVDIQVTLGQESTITQVYLTAKVSGHDVRTGEPTLDAREANLTMAKHKGEWVVTSVETRDTLQRP